MYRPLIININEKYLFGRRRNLTPESSEKIPCSGGNQTDDPPSYKDTRTTDLLQALWRAESKFNYYYASPKGPVSGLARHFREDNAREVCNERKQFPSTITFLMVCPLRMVLFIDIGPLPNA